MQVVLFSADLMLVAAAQGAADRRGVQLVSAANAERALDAVRDETARIVVIDLKAPGLQVGQLVPQLKLAASKDVTIVACGPHVHEQSLAAAAAAGCDEVITRGQFERGIDALLAKLTARAE